MRTFIIAEIGQAHDGSLGMLHSYIDALAGTGVDALKFQTHIAEAESSEFEPFRVKFSYEDATRFDYWKRMGFTFEQWTEIKQHCTKRGMEFISSPFSNEAVDWLIKLGVARYKIGSGEVTNHLMLEKIARTGKEIILSSGMSSYAELDETIGFLKPFGNNVSIMQCTTKYPTGPEDVGINVIAELKDRYNLPVGLSDHSGTVFPCYAAATLGVDYLEFHVVFDKRMFGPDTAASLTIDEVKHLVNGVRFIEEMMQSRTDKTDNSAFSELKTIFEKSLCVNKHLKKGDTITISDLDGKKPSGYGIAAKSYKDVIGKVLTKDKTKWDFLNEGDYE